MVKSVALPGGRGASYEVIGAGSTAMIFAGDPGFAAAYINGEHSAQPQHSSL